MDHGSGCTDDFLPLGGRASGGCRKRSDAVWNNYWSYGRTSKNEQVTYYGETELALEWPWESPFYMNEEITEVIVHEGVYGLGTGAFYGCSNLRKAVLQKVYVMGYSTDKNLGVTFFPFTQCPKLELIEIYYPYGCDTPNGIMYDDHDAPIGEPMVTTAKTMDDTDTPTGLESIQDSEVSIQKVLLNGNLYILKGGQLYDAQGKMIKK